MVSVEVISGHGQSTGSRGHTPHLTDARPMERGDGISLLTMSKFTLIMAVVKCVFVGRYVETVN